MRLQAPRATAGHPNFSPAQSAGCAQFIPAAESIYSKNEKIWIIGDNKTIITAN
jgi:hypothetical protein